MVEFAVVLPILLLLTVGTLLLTVSYVQKLRMNGLAYMSARVAAVRRPDVDAAAYTLQQYKEVTRQAWIDEVQATRLPTSESLVGIQLQKPGERLDILANLVSGQPGQQPMDLIVQMQLPREYAISGSLRPKTDTIVDYRYEPSGLGEVIGALPKGLIDTSQMAEDGAQALGLVPSNTRLKAFYDKYDWQTAYASNDEKPSGQFKDMQDTYQNFALIEQGGNVLNLILKFAGFAGPLKAIVGELGEQAINLLLRALGLMRDEVDQNIQSSFRSGS